MKYLLRKRTTFLVLTICLAMLCSPVVMPQAAPTVSAAEPVLAWTAMTSGTTEPLYDVWGSSSSNVFAVGYSSTILHYDGSDWTPMDTDAENKTFRAVWGASSSDVFAVGSGLYAIYHYDGSSWTGMSSSVTNMKTFYDVWGSSSSDVFAVGLDGRICHWDGSSCG